MKPCIYGVLLHACCRGALIFDTVRPIFMGKLQAYPND